MSAIFQSRLFQGFTLQEINQFFRKYSMTSITYKKGDLLAHKDDPVDSIGIIESGEAFVEDQGLKKSPGTTIGETLLFSSSSTYPSNIIATTTTQVLYLKKEELLSAFATYTKLLQNYLYLMSQQAQLLGEHLQLLSQASLRDKILSYVKSKYDGSDKIPIGMTKENLAKYLNVKRPSLSRELIYMRLENVISTDRNYFYILDKTKVFEDQ
jgi:CRP/FNR family transcriptional regulator, dissimilatory nitrate respiration regulator